MVVWFCSRKMWDLHEERGGKRRVGREERVLKHKGKQTQQSSRRWGLVWLVSYWEFQPFSNLSVTLQSSSLLYPKWSVQVRTMVQPGILPKCLIPVDLGLRLCLQEFCDLTRWSERKWSQFRDPVFHWLVYSRNGLCPLVPAKLVLSTSGKHLFPFLRHVQLPQAAKFSLLLP